MNPVTQALMRQIEDVQLQEFVEAWDALEELAVAIYRSGAVGTDQGSRFEAIRATLQSNFARWQPAFEPFWREARVNGQPLEADPFASLIALPDAQAFVENWPAMQTLPAAREALNEMLIERIEAEQ